MSVPLGQQAEPFLGVSDRGGDVPPITQVDRPMDRRARTKGKPSLSGTVRRLLPLLILLAAGREASCAPHPPQQFQHFAAPRPLQPGHTLVVGFMGGRDSWRNTEVGVGRTANWLRQTGKFPECTWRPSRTSSGTWPFDWCGPAWTATATAASKRKNGNGPASFSTDRASEAPRW